jgi:hypothetical protein
MSYVLPVMALQLRHPVTRVVLPEPGDLALHPARQSETARLHPMAKMNVDRARGGDDDFGAVGDEPTMPAKYAGTCATCGQRFAIGDPIASVRVDKKTTYHHGACRYPATALLAPDTILAPDTKCRATTSKGTPCNNTPQKGEQFCGPHLSRIGMGRA